MLVPRELPPIDPATAAERAVLGDELQQRGDPQGELIGMQLALAALPPATPPLKRSIIERKIAAVIDRHHDALFGPLAPYLDSLSRPDVRLPALEVVRWQAGFLDTVRIRDTKAIQIPQLCGHLRGLPIARHLRRVWLGLCNVSRAIVTIVQTPLTLVSLVVDNRGPDSAGLRSTAHLQVLLRSLEELVVLYPATLSLPLASPVLRSLALTGTSTAPVFGDLPALELLALRSFVVDASLFDQPATELLFEQCTFTPAVLEELLASTRRRRITIHASLDDSHLDVVVRLADQIAQLDALVLYGHRFTPEAVERARERLPANVEIE
ncbi:MAG: hypothetical protein ABI867_40070 [Kofleriaceae bacterium]